MKFHRRVGTRGTSGVAKSRFRNSVGEKVFFLIYAMHASFNFVPDENLLILISNGIRWFQDFVTEMCTIFEVRSSSFDNFSRF